MDIAPFVALNSGTSPDTATITVSTIKSGCASTQNRSFQIIVNPSPIVFPVASQILCAGNNTSVIHFSSTPAGNTYSWSHSNASIGLAASGTGDSIQSFVAVNNGLVPVIDTFSVVAFNAGLQCTGAPVKFTIKIYPLPVVSTASTSTTCNANDGIATALVSSGTPAYSYLWTPGNQTTATVTNLAPGPYSVRVTDSKGCKKIAAVTVSAGTSGPPAPAAIFGEPSGCRSTCSNIYSIAAVSGATSYVWTLPLHATGSSTGTSISVCFDALYTTGSICVQAVNSCGTSSPTCKSLPLSTVAPAIPGTITGPVALCSPNCTTYSIPAVPNATSYVWTTTGGLVINSGLGTTSISVCASPGFANGRVEVSAKNCFGISGIRGINVTGVTAIPAWTSVSNVRNISGGICGPGPGGISNNASTSGSWRYEVSPVIGASSLTWSAPPNFVITDGNGHSGNPLTVIGVNPLGSYGVFLFVPVGFVSGNVSVYATNGCGTSAIASLAITSAPATPGAISGPVSVCRRATKNYSINPITGASSYTWAVTGGAAIKSGQGTRAVSIKFDTSSSTTVLLSVVANDVCNSSAPASLSIAVNPACRSGEDETGVTDLATSYQLNSLIVFPNPATSKVNLEFFSDRKANYAMKIIDAVGRMLYNENMAVVEGVNSKEVNIENIAPGMYLISLQHEGDDVQNLRLIVE